ncbi:Shikimate kinase [Thermosinus carboxydivorans Nor1]|uniref:Shikimate kinase n=1 Tax=Thermosinus carboxydivorans Nor1 TaxID=401526 RepID=A1HQ10_9FIRM|nr:shikimate kinase [Thermosinus carboxydivorans]EAX47861.1 Shikimate kinase [Thermosinus carboxydivorans Nor1]
MKNIVLIGFMGTGKTCTGRLLAQRLRRVFVDIDKKIELEQGMTISEIFHTYGEAYFRQRERATIAKVARYTNTVIATGGGAVLNPDNIICLKQQGVVIWLTASPDVIFERTSRRRGSRPLLDRPNPRDAIAELLAERRRLYQAAADFTIDTTAKKPWQVVDEIIDVLQQGGYLRGRSRSKSWQG